MKLTQYILLIFLVAFCSQASCQHYINYTTRDGLPSATLYTGIQDSNGFMLINSKDGLIRFDGNQFELFNINQGLPDNEILNSRMDQDAYIWLRLFGGKIGCYKDGVIYTDEDRPILRKLNGLLNQSKLVYFDHSTDGSIVFHQPLCDSFFIISNNQIIIKKLEGVRRINRLIYHKKYLYVLLSNRMYSISPDGKIDTTEFSYRSTELIGYHQGYFFSIENAMIWLDDELWNPGDFSISRFALANGRMEKVVSRKVRSNPVALAFSKDQIFFTQKNSLMSANLDLTETSLFHRFDYVEKINGISVDRQSNLWAFTKDKGLFLFPHNRRISTLTHNIIPNGVYLLGNAYSMQGNKLYQYKGEEKKVLFQGTDGTEFGRIRATKTVGSKIYFLTDNDIELVVYDTSSRAIEDMKLPYYGSLKDFDVLDGTVLLGTKSGFFSKEGGVVKKNMVGIRTTSVCFGEDKNEVFAGTLNGILHLRREGSKWDKVKDYDQIKGRILKVRKDQNGVIWVLELNKIKALLNGEIVCALDETKGLKSNTLNDITVDSNKLIVATNKGVTVVHYDLIESSLRITRITSFGAENGLLNSFVNKAWIEDNMLIVSTNDAMHSIDMKPSGLNKRRAPYIMSFKAGGQELSLDSLSLRNEQKHISISFSSLTFPAINNFAYRIKELGDMWHYTNSTSCEFNLSAPGSYHFELSNATEAGELVGKKTVLSFYVRPAFWQTDWFKLAIFIVAVCLSLLVLSIWLKRKRVKLALEKNFAELKIQALKAQMNPHFIFNCLNAIQSIMNDGDMLQSNEYIAQFSKLIRQTLNFSSLDHITLEEEIEYLRAYIEMEKLRFDDLFNYTIELDEKIDIRGIIIPPMLLQVYVENAIRHGLAPKERNGELRISFRKESDFIVCHIEDNGVGIREKRSKHGIYQSKGLSLNEDRLNAYKLVLREDITLEVVNKMNEVDGSPSGTTIIVRIPIT